MMRLLTVLVNDYEALSTGSSLDSDGSHYSKKRLNMPMMYQLYESQYDDLRGTVYGPESPDFHPVQAAETMRKALSGIDTNDQVIISTILYHDNFQRQKILNAYEDMYNRSLLDDIEEEAGGYFLEICQALFKPAHQYDTMNLYKSLSNRYGDHSVAIELACTRSARQLRVIKETYGTDFKKSIERDITVKVEGVFGRCLTMLLTTSRDEAGKKPDEELVEKHVQILLTTPLEEIARSSALFEQLFVGHSWKHIGAVLDKADEVRKDDKELEAVIRKNRTIHSEIRLMLLTIMKVSRNMQIYFAEKLHTAMTGDRPDHATIIRICVTRSEIDLYDISEEYKRKYHRTLEMFRRAFSSLGRVAVGLGGVQLGAAAAVALTDKQLNKKPEWYQNAVRSLESQLKRLSKYGFIESESTLNEAKEVLDKVAEIQNCELQWRIARVLAEQAELCKCKDKKAHLLHEAKEHAKKALAVEPGRGVAGAHKWYAIVLMRLDSIEKKSNHGGEIVTHLEKATNIDSKDPYAFHLLGIAHYNNRDYKEAAAACEKAEAIKAGFSASNLYYLGAALKELKKKDEAVKHLKQAAQLVPKNTFDGKNISKAKYLMNKLGLKPEEYEPEDL
ncbi:hypothetical protein WR25_22789 [Diploscapter pachys]|uniref:Uncharacterized protein n=1 Tax=Diploscapter pachys TaxID=2018661 RepID=A0A2A2JJI3_9BILA|nr:hypothetical protein WR25_22789 [Diploscapter pachys]